MKKLILLALCGLSLSTNAQVTGIGFLKLGSNISIMNQFEPIGKIDGVKETSYGMKYSYLTKDDSWNAVEYISDTNSLEQISTGSLNHSNAFYDKRCRVFEITNPIKINEDVSIKEVRLIFFNDTLVSIECDNSTDLGEAIDLKYGKVDVKVTKIPHKFTRTINGSQITLTDELYRVDRSTPKIKCLDETCKYYSSSIKPGYWSFFIIEYKNIFNLLEKEDEKYKKRIQKSIEEKKKANLKDF